MGYYTEYSLAYNADEATSQMVDSYLSQNGGMKFALVEKQPSKWYHWKEDMKTMSQVFPTITFTLTGVGEEHSEDEVDTWKATFLNGLLINRQQARIVWENT